ncbi:M61 family metallopeptidase [Pelistega ratti]
MTMKDILYRITPIDLAGHLFSVELQIQHPDPNGQYLSLPTWIPGSYLVRDFSRHIQQVKANNTQQPLSIKKQDNHTWQVQPSSLPITITYLVYAWDLSVRAAHLDETHAFFNGTSVFLQVHGQEDKPCYVDICPHPQKQHWEVYTSLPEAKNTKHHQFGLYVAPNYDALIDHPVEIGTPTVLSFDVCGIPHEMVFTGLIPNMDTKRITHDVAKICEYQIKFFEPETHQAPFLDSSNRYVFMTMVTGNDYGGLEHRASTALMASRQDFPVIGQETMSEAYCQFLGLVSHEYFHSWNVKRIKPQVFAPYNLSQATPTHLLWIFEGFTSYYDDLILFRAGLIDEDRYLSLVQKTINSVYSGTGRFKQSVAESSFDAWTKYYKQDENSINSIVSYYTKGSLVALGLDLFIRQHSSYSLDDVMRLLWQKYGRHFYRQTASKGLGETEFINIIKEATGVDTTAFIQRYAYGTEDIPLAELCLPHGILLSAEESDKPSLHIRTKTQHNYCQISQVFEGGSAHQGGLSAGDIFVAIDGIRVDDKNLDILLNRYRIHDTVEIYVFRRDELRKFNIKLLAALPSYTLKRTP